MAVQHPPFPTEKREPAWRRACLAYHEWREAGAKDQEAHDATIAVVHTVLPLPTPINAASPYYATAPGLRPRREANGPVGPHR